MSSPDSPFLIAPIPKLKVSVTSFSAVSSKKLGRSGLSKVSDSEMEKQDFLVYPNPADNYIILNIPDNAISTAEVMIFDLGGRMIYHNHIGSNERINTEGLDNGIYLLRTKGTSGRYLLSKKIIIQH